MKSKLVFPGCQPEGVLVFLDGEESGPFLWSFVGLMEAEQGLSVKGMENHAMAAVVLEQG